MAGTTTTPAHNQFSEIPRGLCWVCGYSLRGLATPRCPECGHPFDPDQPNTMNFGPSGRFAQTALFVRQMLALVLPLPVCLGVSWFTYLYRGGAWSAFFWAPGIYLAIRRRWVSLIVFLLLTPLTMDFFQDASEYARGSSRYVNGTTIIWHPHGSIDPKTRIRGHNPGCGTRSPNYWIRSLAEYLAGTAMYHLTGPPPGAYTGPYPTETEALTALHSATLFSTPDNWDGKIPLPSGTLAVDQEWFISQYAPRSASTPPPAPATLIPSAVLWRRRCLIVKVPRDTDNGPFADVYLIDVRTCQLFGMYGQTK